VHISTTIVPLLLTPPCRVLLEQLTGLQLVKKFPAFHGTPRCITALTNVRQLSLSRASPIQSIYPHPTTWRSILISTHLRLGLPSGLFPFGPKENKFIPHNSFSHFKYPFNYYCSNYVWVFQAVLFLQGSPPKPVGTSLLPHTCHMSCRSLSVSLSDVIITVIPRLTKIIRSGITFVSRNVISRRFL